MFGFGKRSEEKQEEQKRDRRGAFTPDEDDEDVDTQMRQLASMRYNEYMRDLIGKLPTPVHIGEYNGNFAMDAVDSPDDGFDIKAGMQLSQPEISEAVLLWFSAQTFIGHQMSAILAQHWLIDKACKMPARDALRVGYDIISRSGDPLTPDVLAMLKDYDEAFNVEAKLEEFIYKGRIFGIRVAFFDIASPDPKYYEKPFNIDGVMPGAYRGIVQVDPYWMNPVLDARASSDPTSPFFYEPTWWQIRSKLYHRSHLMIFRNGDLPDILKPSYLYGGVPVPQRIMERVYNAERTANEGPLLAMSKRTTILKTDIKKAFSQMKRFMGQMYKWLAFRDNFQLKVIDKDEEEVEQIDTSLTDLDNTIMIQYQLVAAGAEVPATKLLQAPPKGMDATGEYDEANYHESLESIQKHDARPFLMRHHMLVCRSYIRPKLGQDIRTDIKFNPLDSMTAKEHAEVNLIKAQTDVQLVQATAIDGVDSRQRLINDKNSGYTGIPEAYRPDEDPPTPDAIPADTIGKTNEESPTDETQTGMGGSVQRGSGQGEAPGSVSGDRDTLAQRGQ